MKRAAINTKFNPWQNIPLYEVDLVGKFSESDSVYKRTIPIRTTSEANSREHWHVAARRHSMQKTAVLSFLRVDKPIIKTPCHIHLTRIAPRKLDRHENLPMSFKYIVDAICEYIHPNLAAGRADDDPNIRITYDQKKGIPKEYAIIIEIESSKGLPSI